MSILPVEGLWELRLYGLQPRDCETEDDFIWTMHDIARVVKEQSGLAAQGKFDADELSTFMWRVQHDIDHAIWRRAVHRRRKAKKS